MTIRMAAWTVACLAATACGMPAAAQAQFASAYPGQGVTQVQGYMPVAPAAYQGPMAGPNAMGPMSGGGMGMMPPDAGPMPGMPPAGMGQACMGPGCTPTYPPNGGPSACGPNGAMDASCEAGCQGGCDTGCGAGGCEQDHGVFAPLRTLFGCCSGGKTPLVWGSVDYLFAFRKSRSAPPLVTTSVPGTSQQDAGVLGLDTTSTLFGGEGMEDNPSPGVRAELGMWLDCCNDVGVGASFLGYDNEHVSYAAQSDGSTIIARPFYNTFEGAEGSQLVAFPGIVAGTINVVNDNLIQGADIFLRKRFRLWPEDPDRVDFLFGYQWAQVEDSLHATNHLVSLDPSFLGQIGTTLDAYDDFSAHNTFHGGTLGVKAVHRFGCWSLDMMGKVGLGNMHEAVAVNGQTTITVPGETGVTSEGGLLTQSSNIGVYERDRFAVVPEARIVLNYHFTPRLSAGLGYHFIYFNRVALAGDQIDRNIDITQSTANPTFVFHETDTFVHSATCSLTWNY